MGYCDYYRNPFPHSLLSTRQFSLKAMTLQPSIARQLFWTLGRWSRVKHDKAHQKFGVRGVEVLGLMGFIGLGL